MWIQHLAGVVHTNQGEVLVPFVMSQRIHFLDWGKREYIARLTFVISQFVLKLETRIKV